MLRPDGAFTALTLLLVSGVSAYVPPPTNVAVSCQNVKITLTWVYSQPHTSFKIKFYGDGWNNVTVTREHHYDLTQFFWESTDRFLAFSYVTVTAVEGDEESKAAESNTFSFNSLKTVDTKCTLEFPPVDVNSHYSGATVSFPNPVHFYPELKDKFMPTFSSTISMVTDDQAHETSFECTDREPICKHDVPIPEGFEKCVRLKGVLLDGNGVEEVVFRKTNQICAPPLTEVQMIILLSVLLSIFVLVLTGIVAFICMTKAWTTEKPKCLINPLQRFDSKEDVILIEPNEEISNVNICERVVDIEGGELPEGSSNVDKWVPEERGPCGIAHSEGACGTDYSEGACGTDLEDQSHYMSRERIEEDMGNGDIVKGYKGVPNMD